jgi:hypothetical protein
MGLKPYYRNRAILKLTSHPLVTVGQKRLLKLAIHLYKTNFDKLGRYFDFGTYHNAGAQWEHPTTKQIVCGTSGCAIGELPYLEENVWIFSDNAPILKDLYLRSHIDPVEFREENEIIPSIVEYSSLTWFKIKRKEYAHLFLPVRQNILAYGGKELGAGATPQEVADNIIIFLCVQLNLRYLLLDLKPYEHES